MRNKVTKGNTVTLSPEKKNDDKLPFSEQRGTEWEFTLNNYSELDIAWLKGMSKEVAYLVVAKEVGESGTPHLQGSIGFRSAHYGSTLKKMHKKISWDLKKCKDTLYIRKFDSDIIIDIDNRHQGERTDIKKAYKIICQKGIRECVRECPKEFIKYHSGLLKAKMYMDMDDERDPDITVKYIWGKTGVGKSKLARKGLEKKDYWRSHGDLNWFDGYDNHKTAILDDLRGCNVKFNYLLQLLDIYPMDVPIKGGFTKWCPKTIIITSSYPPEKLYSDVLLDKDDNINQLLRRITETIHLR